MATFNSKVVMDPVEVARYIRDPRGPVLRELLVAGQLVKREAQRRVGVHKPVPGERRTRRPGTLRDSHVVRVVQAGQFPAVQVGTEDPVGRYQELGTVPHPIFARRKPLLVFFWKKVGHVVAFKKVNHPGNKATHYLSGSLEILRGRYH